MNKYLSFDVNGIDSLENLMRKGLIGYATNAEQLGGMTAVWCFFDDNSILKIHSTMTDTVGWNEVGTLVFRLAIENESVPQMTPLPQAWRNVESVEKLVLMEDDLVAESGVEIRTRSGEVFTVVCSANVYRIEIAAPFFSGKFEPEYELTRYRRLPL